MQQTREVTELDALIDELGNETEAQCELLLEHLETARAYLVGSMPGEYRLNLKLASETMNCVSDRNLRWKLEDFIRHQQEA